MFLNLYNTIKDSRIGRFLKSLGIVFVYNRAAAVFTTIVAVLTARVLGPVEFGKIILITNFTNILSIPVLMGLNNSMYKFLPASDEEERNKLMSTALAGNILLIFVFTGIYLNSHQLGKLLNITAGLWQTGIVLTIVLNLYVLSESFLRGRQNYPAIGKFKLSGSIIFFLLVIAFFYIVKKPDSTSYFTAFLISQVVFIVITFRKLKIKLFKFSWPEAGRIYKYGTFNMFNTLIIAILFSGDLFIVNHLHSGIDAGIYSVYQGFVKNLFVVLFYEVFTVVFLPTIAHMDKPKLYTFVNKLMPVLFLLIVIGSGLLTIVAILLFGKEYSLNYLYVILVAVSIGLFSVFQIYNSIFFMEGNKGAGLCLVPLIITVPIALPLQYFLTRYYGITGAMTATIISNLLMLILLKMAIFLVRKNILAATGIKGVFL